MTIARLTSMTAFAARSGQSNGFSWGWEMKSVNARGLDMRFRMPEAATALEPSLRATLSAQAKRGNITINLRLSEDGGGAADMALDADQLDRVLQAFDTVQDRALALGITLGQPTAADVLAQRGVIANGAQGPSAADRDALHAALLEDFAVLVDEFCAMRRSEGAALGSVITDQLDRIATLTDAAAEAAEARRETARENLTSALARVMEDVSIEEDRLAQELALLAVKADVTEEIDRLHAHVAAARALLQSEEPQGRKLDFLAQEFNREANTLCSKAGAAPLTAIGLDLKAAIEQMREQIQNVE